MQWKHIDFCTSWCDFRYVMLWTFHWRENSFDQFVDCLLCYYSPPCIFLIWLIWFISLFCFIWLFSVSSDYSLLATLSLDVIAVRLWNNLMHRFLGYVTQTYSHKKSIQPNRQTVTNTKPLAREIIIGDRIQFKVKFFGTILITFYADLLLKAPLLVSFVPLWQWKSKQGGTDMDLPPPRKGRGNLVALE